MTKKYYEVSFRIDQMPNCCGVGVVGGFIPGEGSPKWWGGPAEKPIYSTLEEQAEDTYKKIVKQTWDLEGWDGQDNAHSSLMISLVSDYGAVEGENNIIPDNKKRGDHQWPELQDILLREGWQIVSVFINPNHGNEVTVFTKYFPERTQDPYSDEHAEEEEVEDWD